MRRTGFSQSIFAVGGLIGGVGIVLDGGIGYGPIGIIATPAHAQTNNGVIGVPSSDPVMAQAINKAKASLPDFFTHVGKPGPGEDRFAVKIYYPTAKGGEHIWATVAGYDGTMVTASISNEPVDIPDLKLGQRVAVPVDRLTDWMYFRERMIVGGQTIRAILPRMEAAEAAQFKAMLAPE